MPRGEEAASLDRVGLKEQPLSTQELKNRLSFQWELSQNGGSWRSPSSCKVVGGEEQGLQTEAFIYPNSLSSPTLGCWPTPTHIRPSAP